VIVDWVAFSITNQESLIKNDSPIKDRIVKDRWIDCWIDGLMSRFLHLPSPEELPEEDPLSGIANLFDVSVVFIVGLMITLFSVYRMADLVDAQSEVTMVKTNAQGEREIIVKKGTKITAYKVSGKTATGDGERLGTAYRLANGQIIYVPEGPDDTSR
jgi:hypothetical protein